jgi:hypothetical protein
MGHVCGMTLRELSRFASPPPRRRADPSSHAVAPGVERLPTPGVASGLPTGPLGLTARGSRAALPFRPSTPAGSARKCPQSAGFGEIQHSDPAPLLVVQREHMRRLRGGARSHAEAELRPCSSRSIRPSCRSRRSRSSSSYHPRRSPSDCHSRLRLRCGSFSVGAGEGTSSSTALTASSS